MKKLLIGLLVLFTQVFAAARPVRISRVELSRPTAPVYQGMYEGAVFDTVQVRGIQYSNTSIQPWFRIAAEFETREAWTDRVQIDMYVLFPDMDEVFKGTVCYMDIPEGRDHLTVMYLHFNSYARYYERGRVEYAVVASVHGEVVHVSTNKRNPRQWWETMPVHRAELLNHHDTPFRVVHVERIPGHVDCSVP